jgi:hypothetical protein
VNLPDFEDRRAEGELSPEEIRSKMKEKGIQPPRPWTERPFYISCTGGVFEPYVPPEGDGKISPITVHVSIKWHLKQVLRFMREHGTLCFNFHWNFSTGKKRRAMLSLLNVSCIRVLEGCLQNIVFLTHSGRH